MKESMKTKVNKIKALFVDVDNTALYIKMYDYNGLNDKERGNRVIGIIDDKEWMAYNIRNNAYLHCEAPRQMINIVNYLRERGVKIYGLTECKNSFEYNAKFNRLKECYPGSFLHHGELISVHTRHDKIPVMQMIMERDNLKADEIMFIDDSYFEVMEAYAAGMLSVHTTEALIRFDDMEDFKENI
jgi:FMN phosphatase YigB (HAD superfamily)